MMVSANWMSWLAAAAVTISSPARLVRRRCCLRCWAVWLAGRGCARAACRAGGRRWAGVRGTGHLLCFVQAFVSIAVVLLAGNAQCAVAVGHHVL
jgi:hypothetical protein